jgi:hypothetical protein
MRPHFARSGRRELNPKRVQPSFSIPPRLTCGIVQSKEGSVTKNFCSSKTDLIQLAKESAEPLEASEY